MSTPNVKTRDELAKWVEEEIEKIDTSRKKKELKEKLMAEVFATADKISATLEPDSTPDTPLPHSEQKPPEPKQVPGWFPAAKKFTPTFTFLKEFTYEFAGKTREVRKLKLLDTTRLSKKLPTWINYLGWDQMQTDSDTLSMFDAVMIIGKIITGALADYDIENECPGPFMLSVCEEIAIIMGYDDITMDEVVCSDADEIYAAVMKIWEGNYAFFCTIWENSGTIRVTISTLVGVISRGFKMLKEKADNLFSDVEKTDLIGTLTSGGSTTS